MSVVNKMLQDLETRKKSSVLSADYVQSSDSERGPFKPWMLGASVCVVSLAILLSQVKWQSEGAPHPYAQQLPPSSFIATEPVVATLTVPLDVVPASADINNSADLKTSDLQHIADTENTAKILSVEISDAPSPEVASHSVISKVVKRDAVKDETQASDAPVIHAQLLSKAPQNVPTGEFSVSPSSGAKAGISSLREQARIALNNNDIPGALNALQTLIEDYPEDIRARKQLASLLFSHHGVERAYKVLKDGLVLAPADNAMRVMLARVAFKTGNFKDAHTALADHPFPELADIELISFRAALAERLSQHDNAHQDYKLLVAREPRNAKWWLGLGVSQDKLKLVKPAIESYRQAKNLKQLPTQVNTFVEERIAALAGQS